MFPLQFSRGFPYITVRTYYLTQWDTLPHVILTSDTYRDPSVIDYTKSEYDAWFDNGYFDMYGDFVDQDTVQDTELY